MLLSFSASRLLHLTAASTRRAVLPSSFALQPSSASRLFGTNSSLPSLSRGFVRPASTLIMPPTKSNKSGKAAKAAKAILHPKSTLAAVKANHAQSADASSTTDATPSRSAASSIKRASSNASVGPNTAKPLPSAPSSNGSPATNSSQLPAAAPMPSVLAPAINNDILSMKKQSLDRTKPLLPASLPPAIAEASAGSSAIAPEPVSSSSGPANAAASPYTIGDGVAAHAAGQARDPSSTADVTPTTLGDQAVSLPEPSHFETVSNDSKIQTGNEKFAAEVAEVLASSQPAPVAEPLADAVAAPTPVTQAIVDKAAEFRPDAGAPPQDPAGETSTKAPLSASEISTTAAAAAKIATFTPPELTRLQHNTFVSRPTDPSRAPIRNLDASVLPVPLRPIDRQSGLVRAPTHIVIFGWMDAPIRLVAKYAQPYTVLFPDATVLIQLSDGKSYLARENVRREQLQRVIAEITTPSAGAEEKAVKPVETKDVGDSTVTLIDHSEARSASSDDGKDSPSQAGGFVIHSFSDGGAGNLALFLDEMARRKGTTSRVHSLIMDSSPGKSNPRTGSYAFTMHLANRPRIRAVVQFLVYLGLYLLKIWTKVTGQPARGELMRRRLNSLRSWSWVTASYKGQVAKKEEADFPPRMYMYTKADKLIPWQFVEEHANHLAGIRKTQPNLVEMEKQEDRERVLSAVGQQSGSPEYRVELRRWDTPPHCSIGRADFEGYWAAVMDFYTNVLSRE